MIIVTGAAGFIASCLISKLNSDGFNDIIAVDKFNVKEKDRNLEGKKLKEKIDRDFFFDWFRENADKVEFVFHLGARTDTAEFDYELLTRLNFEYSKQIWKICAQNQIPLVYASSAATYGAGENGYKDSHNVLNDLEPLNPYGVSKNEFDKWAIVQDEKPFFWAGLKFFNVYGPNEYHKGRMASVVLHAYKQIQETSAMKLFRSHNVNYKDGEQLRDFVYVKDVVEVCTFLMHHRRDSAIYNLGTGKARTFFDLVSATFKALGKKKDISFIDTPEDIRDKYQYFTEADMNKLIEIGYSRPFTSLEEGVEDYVRNYLIENKTL